MGRVLHMLLLIAVLACGLDIGEPALAHAGSGTAVHALADDAHEDGGGARDAAPADHHHCPVAPDPGTQPGLGDAAAFGLTPLPATAAPLVSRAQAPPLQPPSA